MVVHANFRADFQRGDAEARRGKIEEGTQELKNETKAFS